MGTKHTPGPWVTRVPFLFVEAEPNTAIAALSAHNRGDAHLIAAAPELLEALEELQDLFEMFGLLSFQDPEEGSTAWKVNNAIAKAKGETK